MQLEQTHMVKCKYEQSYQCQHLQQSSNISTNDNVQLKMGKAQL